MSEERGGLMRRQFDKWLKYAAILGPLLGYLLGKSMDVGAFRQQVNNDHEVLQKVVGWKEEQEKFNQATTVAIARLQEITKKIGG